MVIKTLNMIYKIADYIIALVIGNFGLILLRKEFRPTGISLIITAFLILYFSSYTAQINKNEEDIEKLKEETEKLNQKIELGEKLLNTLKDIILLRKR